MNIYSVNKTLQEIQGETDSNIRKEEVMRLQKYIEMTKRNDVFSPKDAHDFYRLGEMITQERNDDKGAWDILMSATIIFDLHVLVKDISRQKK